MTYLIYRCQSTETIKWADKMRDMLAIDVRCPTCRVVRRVGRNRDRIEVDVPLLGSFIFVEWFGVREAIEIERRFSRVQIMRLPQGGYAKCELGEIEDMEPPVVIEDEEPTEPPPWWQLANCKDLEVLVQRGPMAGVTGTVKRVKQNGEVMLKVTDSKKWQLSTLLIHGSLVTVSG